MEIEENKTDYTLITEYDCLDPVHVWTQDIAKNQGRIVIVCYGCALNAYWGSMGGTIKEFFAKASVSYIFNIFEHNIRDSYDVENYECYEDKEEGNIKTRSIEVGNKMSEHQKDYICRIIKCVKEAFAKQLDQSPELLEVEA